MLFFRLFLCLLPCTVVITMQGAQQPRRGCLLTQAYASAYVHMDLKHTAERDAIVRQSLQEGRTPGLEQLSHDSEPTYAEMAKYMSSQYAQGIEFNFDRGNKGERAPNSKQEQYKDPIILSPYDAKKHEAGIREILSQKTPYDMSYSYLVGPPNTIISAASNPQKYVTDVITEGPLVQGFSVCCKSDDRIHKTNEKFWYVEWLALHQRCQGKKNFSQALWDKIVKNATHLQLPIMLNTLQANAPMQKWCKSRGLQCEGSRSKTDILLFYSYRNHLPPSSTMITHTCSFQSKKPGIKNIDHHFATQYRRSTQQRMGLSDE